MKKPKDLDPASPIIILEGLKLKIRYAARAGTNAAVRSAGLLSKQVPAKEAITNVATMEITERDPDSPSMPSVAFVAFMETTKSNNARK